MRHHHQINHRGNETKCPKCNLPKRYNNLRHKCQGADKRGKKHALRREARSGHRVVSNEEGEFSVKDFHLHVLKDGEDPKTFRTVTSHLVKMEKNGKY